MTDKDDSVTLSNDDCLMSFTEVTESNTKEFPSESQGIDVSFVQDVKKDTT